MALFQVGGPYPPYTSAYQPPTRTRSKGIVQKQTGDVKWDAYTELRHDYNSATTRHRKNWSIRKKKCTLQLMTLYRKCHSLKKKHWWKKRKWILVLKKRLKKIYLYISFFIKQVVLKDQVSSCSWKLKQESEGFRSVRHIFWLCLCKTWLQFVRGLEEQQHLYRTEPLELP